MYKKKDKSVDYIGNYSCDRAVFRREGKWGVLGANGIIVVKPRYDYISTFADGLALVIEASGAKGVIKADGSFVVVPKDIVLGSTSEGMISFSKRGVIRTYSTLGHELKVTTPVMRNLWGFLDRDGDVVVDPEYLYVGRFKEGLCTVRRQCKKVFKDATKKKGERTETVWLWGFINNRGIIIIPCIYDKVRPFHEERAVVEMDKVVLTINKDGNIVERKK